MTFFGWYGLTLELPAGWEPARVKGGRRAGYVAFDDGERVRLEMDWKPGSGKASVAEIAEKQLGALEKTAKRRRIEFHVERKRKVPGLRGFEYEAWSWRADVSAVEMLARCNGCNRAALVRVLGAKGSPPEDEAKAVLGSLGCECGKDHERWGAFGLDVKVPTRFELDQSALKTGLTELVFTDKKAELRVQRVSLGRMVLEKQKLVAWFEGASAGLLKPFEVAWAKEDERGHLGWAGEGGERANRRLLGVFRSKRRVAARLFYCEPSDKIFAIAADGAGDVAALVREVAAGIACHG